MTEPATSSPATPAVAPVQPARVPEVVHLVPSGTFYGRDGRGPWAVRNPKALIGESLRRAVRGQIPMDYDHQIDTAAAHGGNAPAAGWITRLEARDDGVWGHVEWTAAARARIAAREYRFISPVFRYDANRTVVALLRAALTNNPNLSQLTALNSMGATMDLEALLARQRQLLSLAPEADAAAIIDAIERLTKAGNTPDPARFVPIEMFETAVARANEANQGLERSAAEAVVDAAVREHRIMGWLRDWGISLCMINRPAFDAFVERTGPAMNRFLGDLRGDDRKALPWHTSANEAATVDPDVARNLGLTDRDIQTYGARRPSSHS